MEPVSKGTFLTIGHHQISECRPVNFLLTVVIQRKNRRMIELRNSLRLALKQARSPLCRLSLRRGRNLHTHHLQRDLPLHTRILRQIHLPHPSTAYQLQKAIPAQQMSFKWHTFSIASSFKEMFLDIVHLNTEIANRKEKLSRVPVIFLRPVQASERW